MSEPQFSLIATMMTGAWLAPGNRVDGLGCLLAGLAIRNPEFAFVIRALSIAAFMVLTTAAGAHVIARAAALTGAPLWKGTIVDERPPDSETLPDDAVPS